MSSQSNIAKNGVYICNSENVQGKLIKVKNPALSYMYQMSQYNDTLIMQDLSNTTVNVEVMKEE
jgi:hypothetical protein